MLELGCGSGLLTKYLVDAGHRVIATDASPAMLDLARSYAVGAEAVRVLVMPGDPLPEVDAVVSVGHPVSYLDTKEDVERAMIAIADAVRPGGVLAFDVCDLEWAARQGLTSQGRVADDWAIVTEVSMPSPDRYIRQMATFLRNDDGTWRRDDERHDNVLIDTSAIPALLEPRGVEVEVRDAFGDEQLPVGLKAVVGRRP